eukprot:g44963.t1
MHKTLTEFAPGGDALKGPMFTCLVCFDEYPASEGACMECQHWLCWECWPEFLKSKVQDGDCALKCPGQNCPLPVEEPFLLVILSDGASFPKYRKWLQKSYVKMTSTLQYCPNAECQHVAEDPGVSRQNKGRQDSSIFCECGLVWCYLCKQEAHFPITCKTRTDYMQSELVQSARKDPSTPAKIIAEQVESQEASTKSCPRCKEPWWKNGGCNHFTCPCGYEFCWVCLRDWKFHNGGFFECREHAPTREEKQMEVQIVVGTQVIQVQSDRDRSLVMRLRQYCQSETSNAEMENRLKSLLSSTQQLRDLSTRLPGCSPLFLYETAWHLQQCHSRIRYSYVYFYLYHDLINAKEGQDDRTREICRSFALSFLSYSALVDSLDRSILPIGGSDKVFVRSKVQVLDIRDRIAKFGQAYYEHLLDFTNEVVASAEDRELVNHFKAFEESLQEVLEKEKEKLIAQGLRLVGS